LMRLKNEELNTKLNGMATSSKSSLDRFQNERNGVVAEVKRLQEENVRINAEHIEELKNLRIKHKEDILSSSSENERSQREILANLEKKLQDTNSDAKKEIASPNDSL